MNIVYRRKIKNRKKSKRDQRVMMNHLGSDDSLESAHSFREYMSSKHQNINFTIEQESIGSLSFLDVKICGKNGKFVTSVYRKPTFSGVFTNYKSFIPTNQKRGLLHTLLHRSFSLCCDFTTFHFQIDHFKTILMKKLPPEFNWFVY